MTIAGQQIVVYEREGIDVTDFSGRSLHANLMIEAVPVFIDATFNEQLDEESLAHRLTEANRLLASIQSVPTPIVDSGWQPASIGLSLSGAAGPSLFVDLLLPPGWAVNTASNGASFIIHPAGATNEALGGAEVVLTNNVTSVEWEGAHTWLSDRFFGGATRLLPGQGGAADRWLVDTSGRGLIVSPSDPDKLDVFANPLMHAVLSKATLRGNPQIQPVPVTDPGYPAP